MPHHHIKGEPDRIPLPRPEDRQGGETPPRGAIILLNNFRILIVLRKRPHLF